MIDLPRTPATGLPSSPAAPQWPLQAQALALSLGLKIGQVTPALVIEISQLSAAERGFLSRHAPAPSLTIESPKARQLKAELALLTDTRLLTVAVNGKTAALLSNMPLTIGTTVELRVRTDGRLQLLQMPQAQPPVPAPQPLPGHPPLAAPAAGVQAQHPRPAQALEQLPQPVGSKPLAGPAPSVIAQGANNALVLAPAKTQQLEATYARASAPVLTRTRPAAATTPLSAPTRAEVAQLHQALKQVAGTARPVADLPRALSGLPTRMPPNLLQALPKLFPLLKELVHHKQLGLELNQLQQSAKPEALLKQALQHSGVFWERQLSRLPEGALAQTELANDTKYRLLTTLSAIEHSLPQLQQQATPAGKPLLEQLFKLFQPHAGKPPKTPSMLVAATTGELEAIAQQIKAAVARIQTQQYQSALSALAEPAQPVTSLITELPVRWLDGFGTLLLHWHEHKPLSDERSKRRKQSSAKTRWQVYMELDIGTSGTLAVELAVTDNAIDADFWASNATLANDADEQLHALRTELEQRGLVVTDLRCHAGAPSGRATAMNYTMIDVRT